jgi:hypothetical protein
LVPQNLSTAVLVITSGLQPARDLLFQLSEQLLQAVKKNYVAVCPRFALLLG